MHNPTSVLENDTHKLLLDFDIQTDHLIEIKLYTSYIYLIEIKFIPIISGALGTVTKGLIRGLEDLKIRGQVETIQTSTPLRSARILRRGPETLEDLLSLKLQRKITS